MMKKRENGNWNWILIERGNGFVGIGVGGVILVRPFHPSPSQFPFQYFFLQRRKKSWRNTKQTANESSISEAEAVESVSSVTRFPDADVAYSSGREIPVGEGRDGGAGNVA
jgi:hypothetical protein